MSVIESICILLGVKIGEEWYDQHGMKYRITYQGLECQLDTGGEWLFAPDIKYRALILEDLKPMWRPNKGDMYYIPDFCCEELCIKLIWHGNAEDLKRFDNGLVFKTSEKARECTEIILDLYNEWRV